MAHLHKCGVCGRAFRCDGPDHGQSAWWWCTFLCPDITLHGVSIGDAEDAKFLRFCDVAIEKNERLAHG